MAAIGHIALFVHDLRQAEAFFGQLFNMRLIMRETPLGDGLWYTLPFDKEWADAETAGIELAMIALQRDALVLALFQGRPSPGSTVLEIGIVMPAEEIAAIAERLPDSVTRHHHEYGDLLFTDPFGYRWHIRTAETGFRSNGEISGRWLEL